MARFGKINETITLFLQLDVEDSSQYPTAVIIDSSGNIDGTVDLTAIAGVSGKYSGTHVFLSAGDYSIKYIVYSDISKTVKNPKYRIGDETIRITNLEKNVEDILNSRFGTPVADFS